MSARAEEISREYKSSFSVAIFWRNFCRAASDLGSWFGNGVVLGLHEMRDEVESPGSGRWASAMEVGISIRVTLSVEYRMHDGGDDGFGDKPEVLDCLSDTLLVDGSILRPFSSISDELWMNC